MRCFAQGLIIALFVSAGCHPSHVIERCVTIALLEGKTPGIGNPVTCSMPAILPADSTYSERDLALMVDDIRRVISATEAERCGKPGCVIAGRSVRVALLKDDFATASVRSSDASVDFVISAGMIRLVTGATSAIESELGATTLDHPPSEGFGRWFEHLNAAGGQSCTALYSLDMGTAA